MRNLEPSWSMALDDGRHAHVIVTDRSHGSVATAQREEVLERRQRAIVDAPWSWMRQVHGGDVLTVLAPGEGVGREADAACTRSSGAPLSVQVADCAPVALVDPKGIIGVAHAGWRGLLAGVLENVVGSMRRLGGAQPVAVLGPCIRPASYEFGPRDLDRVAARLGDAVRGRTDDGRPALDLPGAVHRVLDGLDVEVAAEIGGCTAAEADRWWSYRARGETGRQALVCWIAG